MAYKNITEEIKGEIRALTEDILHDLDSVRSGRMNDADFTSKYHELVAQNSTRWEKLTEQILLVEDMIDETRKDIDSETGYPASDYGTLCDMLSDLQDRAEEYADLFDNLFADYTERLENLVYGEWE